AEAAGRLSPSRGACLPSSWSMDRLANARGVDVGVQDRDHNSADYLVCGFLVRRVVPFSGGQCADPAPYEMGAARPAVLQDPDGARRPEDPGHLAALGDGVVK